MANMDLLLSLRINKLQLVFLSDFLFLNINNAMEISNNIIENKIIKNINAGNKSDSV